MLNTIELTNFKSHKNTQLSLGNLTLLCGENGVGKSSVIQSLLLLRQTYQKNRLHQGLDLLKEMTEHALRTNNEWNKHLLINIKDAFEFYQKVIPVFKDCGNADDLPVFIHIAYVSSFEALETWFGQNRTPRKYNIGDNRHIEGHGKYIPPKSPVLGGFGGKQNLADLLKTAVGDQHAQRDHEDFMNYDPIYNCYVWFEYEEDNPQNQYHGYHLAIPKVRAKSEKEIHTRDKEAEARIPARVMAILKQRFGDKLPD